MITSNLLHDLSMIVTEEQIEQRTNYEKTLFGNDSSITLFPTTEEEIAAILSYANEKERTINIEGNGTKRGYGGTKEYADLVLSLKKYSGIVEHSIGDMTLTVKAGTRFKEIQDYLAPYNQMIPLDPSFHDEATIGGIIAANDSGPKRLGYGSARDLVIGLRIAYPDGQIIRTGGKVVKNVAGYDMNKLFVGSMGTIGVLTDITLKLRPLPKYESVVLLTFPNDKLGELHKFSVEFLDSYMEPRAFELLSPALSKQLVGHETFSLAIGFEDVKSSVHYQEQYVRRKKPDECELVVYNENKAKEFWHRLVTLSLDEKGTETVDAVLKIGVKNVDVIQVIKQCQLFEETNIEIQGHGGIGHGLCTIHLHGTEKEIISAIESFREVVESVGGYVVIKHGPISIRKKIDVWGKKPAHFFLFEQIKEKIDRKKILNVSRFVGGI